MQNLPTEGIKSEIRMESRLSEAAHENDRRLQTESSQIV